MLSRRESSRARYQSYRAKRREGKPDETAEAMAKKKARSRSFFHLFAQFWSLCRGHRAYIALALTTLTIVTGIGLLIPAATKIAIDYIITDQPGPTGLPEWLKPRLPDSRTTLLYWLGGAMIVLSLAAVLIGTLGRWQMTRVTKRVATELRTRAFVHAGALPLHRIYHYKSGGMSSLLREDAGSVADLLFQMIYNPWKAIIQLLGTLVILAWVDWRMLVGGLALIPLLFVTHRTWISRIRPMFRDTKMVRQVIDSTTTEAFGGMRVVRGFNRERAESLRFTTAQHYLARLEVHIWWWSRLLESIWAVLIPAASAGVLIYGGTQVLKGKLTIGDVMMFSTYLLMLLGPMETLTATATLIQNNLAALDRVLDLLHEEPEFHGQRTGKLVSRATAKGDIELRDVWFSYPRAAKKTAVEALAANTQTVDNGQAKTSAEPEPVIKGVSLKVRAGETIALVGPSGSGKTTLCNLIARFYDPTSGSVLFDGTDLRDTDVRSYRSLLGIVEQDVFLFDGTIAQNIAYARRDVSEQEITDAAKMANADGFIRELDKGYNTLIGERGVRLSGGQKQRIAIARALLADPLILILDEATSNLDSESEALIQRSLTTLMQGRTSFVIAHRLSTVRSADRIAVLEAGKLIELGTHDELTALGGRYADLLRLQVEGHKAMQLEAQKAAHTAAQA
ncbi:MAG TPA: ABC transporter ATP-binding protein [Phycisphaerales bacterium]|nr:ABC transporter ATP-binding protein [Phycisphaerales bacterium]